MTTFDVATIAADLTDDNDTHTVEDDDGSIWTFTLHVEPDDMSILDEQGEGVWCGRLEWGRRDANTGNHQRPNGFTGRAEVIYRDGRDRLWWEVPDDITLHASQHDSLRRAILDLIEFGYRYAYLTLNHQRPDGYTREWRTAGVGGLDSVYDEVVSDQLVELIAELTDVYAK